MKILASTLTYPLLKLAIMNLMSLLKLQLWNYKGMLKVNIACKMLFLDQRLPRIDCINRCDMSMINVHHSFSVDTISSIMYKPECCI